MSDEWMAEHKGAYLKTVGYIWECHDDCDCEQAQVVDYFRNAKDSRFRVPVGVWEGTFTTGEGRMEPDSPNPEAELAEYRRQLRATDPEREAAIEWQKGVDYGVDASTPESTETH